MANAFDQFDAPAAPASGGNAFDQFDNPQSAAPSAAASLVPPIDPNTPQLSQYNPTLGQRASDLLSRVRRSSPVESILGKTPDETAQMLEPRPTGIVPNVIKAAGDIPKVAELSPGDLMGDQSTELGGAEKGIAKQANLENAAMLMGAGEVLKAAKYAPKMGAAAKALLASYFATQGAQQGATAAGERAGNPNMTPAEKGQNDSDIALNAAMVAAPVGEAIRENIPPKTTGTPNARKISSPNEVAGNPQTINPKTVAEGSATEVQKPAEEKAVAPNATQAPKPPEILPADQSVSQPAGQADTGDKTTQAATPTLQPAIKIGDKILSGGGVKHANILLAHAFEQPDGGAELLSTPEKDIEAGRGFIDQNGKFYTRAEAAKTGVFGDKLPHSENLPGFDENAPPPPLKVTPVKPDVHGGSQEDLTADQRAISKANNNPNNAGWGDLAPKNQPVAPEGSVVRPVNNKKAVYTKRNGDWWYRPNPLSSEVKVTDSDIIKAVEKEHQNPTPEQSPANRLGVAENTKNAPGTPRDMAPAQSSIKEKLKSAGDIADRQNIEKNGGFENYVANQKILLDRAKAKGDLGVVAQKQKNILRAKELYPEKFETVTPSEDKVIGKNAAGEQLHQRANGQVYRMRFDRKDKPNGYPDFGGDLVQVEQAPAQSSQKFRVGNSPQLHSLVEKLPASEVEIANGEQPVRVKNEKTGDIQTVMESDLTPVTERPAADKLAQASAAKKLDDQLRALKLDPKSFPNVASKRAALKRQKALAIGVGPGAATATGGEFSMPTIEDQLGGGPLAPKRENAPQPTIEPQNKTTINSLSYAVKNAVDATKGFIGGLAGKTFPKTTLISKRLGELGARWISAKIAARPKAELFVAEVLGDSGLKSRDVGAALTEDNLRSIKKAYLDKGDTESAEKVQTLIGKKGSPFKTEEDYQNFLNDPKFKEVVERHRDMWKSTVEPQYRAAMRIDPETELPSRGLQTGARINLRAVREGENPSNVVRTTARGNLLNTLRKKSPFGIQATGTGEAYHTDLHDLMENTFGKQDEIAAKNEFEKALVESGNAVEDKPGQDVNIAGRPAVQFPLTRKTIIADGKPVAVNRSLYVNPKIASEYRIGANVDWTPPKGIFSKIASFINQSAIASATEATTHVMNLGSALFALPATSGKILNDAFLTSFGRADIPVKVVQTIMKSMKDNRAQIAGLSEIGAMRSYHEPTKIPLMRQASQMIQWMDKNTRLVLDDAYQRMRDQGLVDPSETARREFVNQVGQYNQRAQPYLMGQMRKLGISPFVTAGKNFNTLGIREATFNPGVKATSVPAALALRANMLSKWVGTAALLMSVNYLLTKSKGGGVSGRPGTPLGYIDTGEKDKNGRNVFINLLGITGQGRALRVTGIKGFVDAERMGLGAHNGVDSAARDMINAAVSPWAGPLPRFAVGAATGYPIAANVGRAFPVVPPGTSQHLSDFKNAVIQMNPVVAGIHQAMQPNSSGWIDAVRSQFPRLVPQSGRSDSMTKNYPEIVQKAQANEFINYVVHAARTVPIAHRRQFVNEQIKRLPAELQPKAQQEMNYRKVFSDN